MMFGILDWSDEPAADQALQKALAICHRGLGSGMSVIQTRRLAIAGIRPVEFFCSPTDGPAEDRGDLQSWNGELSWSLADTTASAGALDPAGLNGAEIALSDIGRWIAHRLRGDYAVAWWDANKRALVLVRDAMGLRPLFFHHSPLRTAFSSSLPALRSAVSAEDEIDRVFIAHALCLDTEVRMRTVWRAIQRVPAGSHVSLSQDRPHVVTDRWWRPELESRPTLPPDGNWPGALREQLLSAVADRLPEARDSRIVSFLSGGLDSSSVVGAIRAVARDRGSISPLHTLSFRFPGLHGLERRQSDESRFQDAVNEYVDATSHVIRADLLSPLGDIDGFLKAVGEPWGAPNRYLHHAGLHLAGEIGTSVVFDGIDGDSAIGYGVERFEELVRSFRWLQLLREARRLARTVAGRRLTTASVLSKYALPGLMPASWRRKREIERGQQDLNRRMRLLSPALRRHDDVRRDLRARSVIPAQGPDSFAHRHALGLQFGIFELTTSKLQHLAMAHGLRMAFPFFDRELLELSLAVPLDQKLRNGWLRHVLREAIGGLVPEAVRWRRHKSSLAPQFYKGLMTTDRPFVQNLLRRGESALEPYVDIDVLRGASQDLFEREDRSQAMPVLAVVTLARWLELRDERAV